MAILIQKFAESARELLLLFMFAIDVNELKDHVDTIAAEFVHSHITWSRVHCYTKFCVSVEEIYLVHIAALSKRVQDVVNAAFVGKNSLNTFANAIKDRIVVDGGSTEGLWQIHVQLNQLVVDIFLDGLLVTYDKRN